MILHIFSDSVYTYRFIKFIEDNFDINDHQFIIYESSKSRFNDYYSGNDRCVLTRNKLFFIENYEYFREAKKIIIHQLNKPMMMIFMLLLGRVLIGKSVWSIWGSDLYFYKISKTNLKFRLIEFIRKKFIRKIPVCTTLVINDYEVAKDVYNLRAMFFKTIYPNPMDYDQILGFSKNNHSNGSGKIRILIGNSANPVNRHIEILKKIKNYSNFNIEIIIPLSYGGSDGYVRLIEEYLAENFSQKYQIIKNILPFDKYLELLNTIDVALMNHSHQQGVGNLIALFLLEKKVFIDSGVTTFKYLNELGVQVEDINQIEYLSFDEFTNFDKASLRSNFKILYKEISNQNIRDLWDKLFKYK